jgi:hypothetical protein
MLRVQSATYGAVVVASTTVVVTADSQPDVPF